MEILVNAIEINNENSANTQILIRGLITPICFNIYLLIRVFFEIRSCTTATKFEDILKKALESITRKILSAALTKPTTDI